MKANIVSAAEYVERLRSTPEHRPAPIPNELCAVVEAMATASHEEWCAGKSANGYGYGPVVDDIAKTHPLLVPYDDLADSDKEECRRNAVESLTLLLEVGCRIGKPGEFEPATDAQLAEKVKAIVEALHDAWALSKAHKGYGYAEQRNDDASKGPLTHRDMLPFEVLMQIHPEDAAYDRDTANGAIKAVQYAGYIIGIID